MLGNETNHLWSNCDINKLSLDWTQKLRDYLPHFILSIVKMLHDSFLLTILRRSHSESIAKFNRATLFIYLSLQLEDLENAFYIRHPT